MVCRFIFNNINKWFSNYSCCRHLIAFVYIYLLDVTVVTYLSGTNIAGGGVMYGRTGLYMVLYERIDWFLILCGCIILCLILNEYTVRCRILAVIRRRPRLTCVSAPPDMQTGIVQILEVTALFGLYL